MEQKLHLNITEGLFNNNCLNYFFLLKLIMQYIRHNIINLFFLSIIQSLTLQEAYDQSEPYMNFDKYIMLDSDIVYTGGLGIYEGNIFIDCNGAVIDLEGGTGIWAYADSQNPSNLNIQHCTITNGEYYGLSFGGQSSGNIINCNFINTNFGLKLFDESNVDITNCIFAYNNTYGIGVYTENPTLHASYCLFWENIESDCMENCPG